jgi:hypothetical protein
LENGPVGILSNTRSICDHKEVESGAMEIQVVDDRSLQYYQDTKFEKIFDVVHHPLYQPKARAQMGKHVDERVMALDCSEIADQLSLGVESLHQTLCSPFEYLPCGT